MIYIVVSHSLLQKRLAKSVHERFLNDLIINATMKQILYCRHLYYKCGNHNYLYGVSVKKLAIFRDSQYIRSPNVIKQRMKFL